jgi:hypothetical protein
MADTPEAPAPQIPGAAQVFRVRLRFEKSELIRWLSHHDLIRAVDRLLRRLALPVIQSQGFHPQPNIVFALSLPLGAIGCEEILEIDLAQGDWNLSELLGSLNGGTPPGLKFLDIQAIGPKDRARVESLTYRTPVPDFLLSQTKTGIAITALTASNQAWFATYGTGTKTCTWGAGSTVASSTINVINNSGGSIVFFVQGQTGSATYNYPFTFST